MKINQMLDEFLIEAETEEYRKGEHMIPTEMGKRLLRDFAVWCDERLTTREADGAEGDPLRTACQDCGLPYSEFGLDMTLPDEQWLAIHPSGVNGLLCARCIVARASDLKNIVAVRAVLDDGTPRR